MSTAAASLYGASNSHGVGLRYEPRARAGREMNANLLFDVAATIFRR